MQVTCIDGFLNHSVKMVSFIKYPIIFIMNSGGGKRDRTADLLHAMQALSQLSYTPI